MIFLVRARQMNQVCLAIEVAKTMSKKRNNARAKKSLGQNFLIDSNVIDQIIQYVA